MICPCCGLAPFDCRCTIDSVIKLIKSRKEVASETATSIYEKLDHMNGSLEKLIALIETISKNLIRVDYVLGDILDKQ
jgi:hypothetical protein